MFDAIARPFGMLLMFLYEFVGNYGVAIILIALVIKIILLQFQMKTKRGMVQQARLQPKIAELQKKHAANKNKLNEETMKLYKEEGVNPASGCVWGFLPLPIMLALFQVIRRPITMMMGVSAEAYAQMLEKLAEMPAAAELLGDGYYVEIAQLQFISNSRDFNIFQQMSENLRSIDFSFLHLNFAETPQWDYLWNANTEVHSAWFAGFVLFLIPLISGVMLFLAMWINQKKNPNDVVSGQTKLILIPFLIAYFAFVTPAALGLYLMTVMALQIVQDIWLTKMLSSSADKQQPYHITFAPPRQGHSVCPSCSVLIASPTASFCRSCGLNIAEHNARNKAKCENCCQLISADASFCTNCGVQRVPQKGGGQVSGGRFS